MNTDDWLLDTNILLRLLAPSDFPERRAAETALETLRWSPLCFSLQNAAEFWNVATRPVAANGFGLSTAEVDGWLETFAYRFEIVEELSQTYSIWRQLVRDHEVIGKSVHDARLAALMMSHGITQILTFDVGDFARFSQITAVHPSELVEAN